MVEDLDRRSLEHQCDAMSDLSKHQRCLPWQRRWSDAAEPGQQLDGADKLAAVQPPGEGDQQLGCLALGRAEEAMRQGHGLVPPSLDPLSEPTGASYATVGRS